MHVQYCAEDTGPLDCIIAEGGRVNMDVGQDHKTVFLTIVCNSA
jgi:hypothetical protein